ncbi:UDP-2,4-diacetamido-2,4,6-trideoxy-beta-L-altropyranose hydrolase [Jannaschia sp. LMIT008]|uniref:UDP-2,4-diacetamido-2,4, 6-trideoxy-beta-L-altropyranose hydrolase n=1 Tax=Jannaschia maritima TaxID=3032585 RepID=UPI002811A05C|nr:UDP-2,4-diacetamido-2,4,6-trideoxy-beta-L-altropyranose hydrolase [Jannaschia sp. LMIT008]
MTRVLIRADAAIDIGAGHVARCLALAGALRDRGARVSFACADRPGHMMDAVRAGGFACNALPVMPEDADAAATARLARDADRVIVDHYDLGAAWEAAMSVPVMTIDDVGRDHRCDILLDQNLGAAAADYADRVPADALLLIGPDHALLRPDFERARDAALTARRDRAARRLLVTMGGTDPGDTTGWALDALAGHPPAAALDLTVVLGPAAPHLDAVRIRVEAWPGPARLLVGTDRMAALMAEADLAVGAAGSTSWERCCLGLPAATLAWADNQRGIARALDRAGAARAVAQDDAALRGAVDTLLDDDARAAMTAAAAALCDGQGAGRVADVILARTARGAAA